MLDNSIDTSENSAAPKAIHLKDYTSPDYTITDTHLLFELHPKATIVTAKLHIGRQNSQKTPLSLNGEGLKLKAIKLDDQPLTQEDYSVDDRFLTLHNPPEKFVLETVVEIAPIDNTRLDGLYSSNNIYCTQCEAQGFRRITYFLDRPDVLSLFTVRIHGSKAETPVMLSNGNPIEQGDLDAATVGHEDWHFSEWYDPFPKPCYLFALVAGKLEYLEDHFKTRSGRDVTLRIYTEGHQQSRATFAMESLKRSMKWDEDRFQLEYDLDLFQIVAINDFNMGAMENKGLNVFNAKCLLADQDSATDRDFEFIDTVVAHEYFHNWTGNRITCRDWFQLSLKEGLTVFRDQEYTSDTRSRGVKRIDDVRDLRAAQFPEDQGPQSHPVRPQSYMAIDNFYTATVYEKGAEVIRMLHTILGETGFMRGMAEYVKENDGKAATCEDFIAAMSKANNHNLDDFFNWYHQSGTPILEVHQDWDEASKQLSLTFKQNLPPQANKQATKPLVLPIAIGFITNTKANTGKSLTPSLLNQSDDGEKWQNDTMVLMLKDWSQTWSFTGLSEKPAVSINRGFSAPVIVQSDQSNEDLAHLMSYDSDGFGRWEAGQTLAKRALCDLIAGAQNAPSAARLTQAFKKNAVIAASDGGSSNGKALEQDKAWQSFMLSLPGEAEIYEILNQVDPIQVHQAKKALKRQIALAALAEFETIYAHNKSEVGNFSTSAEAMGRRKLSLVALSYISAAKGLEATEMLYDHYSNAPTMTDRMAALVELMHFDCVQRNKALEDFYQQFKDDELVLDKWFSAQALSTLPKAIEYIKKLTQHADFNIKKPNRVRSLISVLAHQNPVTFHAADGSGYQLLKEIITELDRINPQVAARMLGIFNNWSRFDPLRQKRMIAVLKEINQLKNISPNSFEISSKALANYEHQA